MILLSLLAIIAAPPVQPAARPRPISDRQLRAYARQRFDKGAMIGRHVVLGTQRGAAVIADFPCSDVCPQQTRRIIHLAAEPGPACAAAGGVVRERLMPMGIAVTYRPFCVPRVFAAGEPGPR